MTKLNLPTKFSLSILVLSLFTGIFVPLFIDYRLSKYSDEKIDWYNYSLIIGAVGLVASSLYLLIVNTQASKLLVKAGAKSKQKLYITLLNIISLTILVPTFSALFALTQPEYAQFGNCEISISNHYRAIFREKVITYELQVADTNQSLVNRVEFNQNMLSELQYPGVQINGAGAYPCRTGRAELILSPVFNWPLQIRFFR